MSTAGTSTFLNQIITDECIFFLFLDLRNLILKATFRSLIFTVTNLDDQDNSRLAWSRRTVRSNVSTCKCQWRLKIAVESRTKKRLPPDILERLMVKDPRIWGYEGHEDSRLRVPENRIASGFRAVKINWELIERLKLNLLYYFIKVKRD